MMAMVNLVNNIW